MALTIPIQDAIDGTTIKFNTSTKQIYAPPSSSGSLVNTNVKTGPASYNAAVNDFILVNVAGGVVTINLPSTHAAGDTIAIKLVSAATNNCVVDANGSQTIDGQLTLALVTDFEWAFLRSTGAAWMQVG